MTLLGGYHARQSGTPADFHPQRLARPSKISGPAYDLVGSNNSNPPFSLMDTAVLVQRILGLSFSSVIPSIIDVYCILRRLTRENLSEDCAGPANLWVAFHSRNGLNCRRLLYFLKPGRIDPFGGPNACPWRIPNSAKKTIQVADFRL